MVKVLVVEDNAHLRDDIKLELEMNGYSVVEAVDGQAALKVLHVMDSPPDIIVSDLIMPNMDGYALLDAVRAYNEWTEIPFIFLTARDSPHNIRASKELGADDYLVKPFDPDDLLLTIENRLKRAQQMRKGAERQLDGARRELVTMIAHELRTPLSALFGGTELLAQSLVDVPDAFVHKTLNLLHSGTQRLSRVVDNILMMVQIDSGYLEDMLSRTGQHYDIKSIVRNAIEALQYEETFRNSNIQIALNQPDEDICVWGIFDYLYSMVSELLRNAFTFSSGGGTVKVDIERRNDHIAIVITDEGPGMKPEDLDVAWERFRQVNRGEYEQQGVGLGLPLIRESAVMHGGRCDLELPPSGGLRAVLTLPISDTDQCK